MDYATAARPRKQGLAMAGAFTFGIEEEYFLVEVGTKLVPAEVPAAFFDAAKAATDGCASTEFLQPQIEVMSSPHVSAADARAELTATGAQVTTVQADVGEIDGCAQVMAAAEAAAQSTGGEGPLRLVHNAAMIYPTSLRANGSGWQLGIGRLGSIVGPLVGALFVAMPVQQLYMWAALPFALGAVVCFTIHRLNTARLAERPWLREGAPAPAA